MRYPPIQFSIENLVQTAKRLRDVTISKPASISEQSKIDHVRVLLSRSIDDINQLHHSNRDTHRSLTPIKDKLEKALTILNEMESSQTLEQKPPESMKKPESALLPSSRSVSQEILYPLQQFSMGSTNDIAGQLRAGLSGVNKAIQSLTESNIPSNHWLFSPKAPTGQDSQ
jgi:DNA primase large subunit